MDCSTAVTGRCAAAEADADAREREICWCTARRLGARELLLTAGRAGRVSIRVGIGLGILLGGG